MEQPSLWSPPERTDLKKVATSGLTVTSGPDRSSSLRPLGRPSGSRGAGPFFPKAAAREDTSTDGNPGFLAARPNLVSSWSPSSAEANSARSLSVRVVPACAPPSAPPSSAFSLDFALVFLWALPAAGFPFSFTVSPVSFSSEGEAEAANPLAEPAQAVRPCPLKILCHLDPAASSCATMNPPLP